MSVATKNPFALLDGQYLSHRSRSPRADCLLVSFLASPYCPYSTTASRPSHNLTAHTRPQTTPRRVPLPLLPQRTPLLPLLRPPADPSVLAAAPHPVAAGTTSAAERALLPASPRTERLRRPSPGSAVSSVIAPPHLFLFVGPLSLHPHELPSHSHPTLPFSPRICSTRKQSTVRAVVVVGAGVVGTVDGADAVAPSTGTVPPARRTFFPSLTSPQHPTLNTIWPTQRL